MHKIFSGAAAGFSATVPMTAAMAGMHRLLPPEEQYPLPPRLITENALAKAGGDDERPQEQEAGLTLASHFAYGLGMGVVYGAALESADAKPTIANGVAFGLGVWAVSYFALLPAAGLFPPAHRQPGRRNALMIAAHIVWGAGLGFMMNVIGTNDE